MTRYRCPKGCDIDRAAVCGGDLPFHNHGLTTDEAMGNIYFYASLGLEYTTEQITDTPFPLSRQDWSDMYAHADGGCCSEPQCPQCWAYLEEDATPTVVVSRS